MTLGKVTWPLPASVYLLAHTTIKWVNTCKHSISNCELLYFIPLSPQSWALLFHVFIPRSPLWNINIPHLSFSFSATIGWETLIAGLTLQKGRGCLSFVRKKGPVVLRWIKPLKESLAVGLKLEEEFTKQLVRISFYGLAKSFKRTLETSFMYVSNEKWTSQRKLALYRAGI